jgi:hypothetical protein
MLQWRFDGAGELEDSYKEKDVPTCYYQDQLFWNLHCDE